MKLYEILIYSITICFLTTSCKENLIPEQPNIIWITSEDNSKHYLKLFDKNGVETPNIESLAEKGVVFANAFSNAPVCSAARSALISGCYGPRTGSHYHRKIVQVPMPEDLKMFPAYLRNAGYYTSNNSKEDYNIIKSEGVWDDSSAKATWRNRRKDQPFFHVQNLHSTHESGLHFSVNEMITDSLLTDPNSSFVHPKHPNTELFRYSNALYLDKMIAMDKELGELIDKLKSDGLMENTIIFYFGDHGGVLPGSKGYLNETGLHIPLVVYFPQTYKNLIKLKYGSVQTSFVSFIDFGATVLELAGIEIPEFIDGKPFLGRHSGPDELSLKDETYGYADRFDEKYDMVRSYRKGNYKYIRNYMPFNFDGLMNNYRYKQLAYQEWLQLYKENKLDTIQSQFFNFKQPEELFNIETDPYETINLAIHAEYREILLEMRNNLINWEKEMPDLSFFPEYYLIQHAFINPIKFGQDNKEKILEYIDIANLALADFETAKPKLIKNLKSEDSWARYWGLICCSSFITKDVELIDLALEISRTDSILINRVRAAEFLGLIQYQNPEEVMLQCLYSSNDETEALLILNSIVLMVDCKHTYLINLEQDKITKNIVENKLVKERLDYILSI